MKKLSKRIAKALLVTGALAALNLSPAALRADSGGGSVCTFYPPPGETCICTVTTTCIFEVCHCVVVCHCVPTS